MIAWLCSVISTRSQTRSFKQEDYNAATFVDKADEPNHDLGIVASLVRELEGNLVRLGIL